MKVFMVVSEQDPGELAKQEDAKYLEYRDTLIAQGYIESEAELEQLIKNGVLARGFEGCEAELSNEDVAKVIIEVFGDELQPDDLLVINKRNVLDITYDEHKDWQRDVINTAKEQKLVVESPLNTIIALNLGSYLTVAEMFRYYDEMEDSDTHNTLAGTSRVWLKYPGPTTYNISLYSFEARNTSDLDILVDTSNLSEPVKWRLYYLGTIAHEMGHVIDKQLSDEVKEEFAETFKDNPTSPYVKKHIENYGSSADTVIHEDFAECIKLYLINADRMKDEFPEKYEFFQKHFNNLQANHIMNILNPKPQ